MTISIPSFKHNIHLKELLQKQKVQERKERTHRLCERGGYLESILPEYVSLTAEQVKTFLTDFARQTLAGLTEHGGGRGSCTPPAAAMYICQSQKGASP